MKNIYLRKQRVTFFIKQHTFFIGFLLISLIAFQPVEIFAQAPTVTNFTPTTGSIGTLVSITCTNLNNPTAITVAGVSAILISNDGTTLVTMVILGPSTEGISVTTAGGTAQNYTFLNIPI